MPQAGTVSLPSSVGEAKQATGPATASHSPGPESAGMPSKGKKCVDVVRATVAPPQASSRASTESSVVFPPPPITEVIPRGISNASCNFICSPN